jgi:NADH dehydrogenase/NADH:ubiquinone oxidoreductase subunit G
MHKKLFWVFAILMLAMGAGPAVYAQEKPADAVANVPALETFHEVIFKIWHEAWPKKNAAMLQQLLPDVEKGISEVASAKLPGILHEKKSAWDEGVKKLQGAGAEYKAAAAAKDDPKLLAAAEKLHGQYEGLVRVIRPALKELDDFHAVLYLLFHHYLPNNDMKSIRTSAGELKQKMTALNAATLSERLKQKEDSFQAARKKLSDSVDALESVAQTNADQRIKDAVNALHSNYQALEKVFE